jgi:hypothetical protein
VVLGAVTVAAAAVGAVGIDPIIGGDENGDVAEGVALATTAGATRAV